MFQSKQDFMEAAKRYFSAVNKNVPSNYYHYSSLKNCTEAAEFLAKKILDGKRILIVGDYDADGIIATVILYSFFLEAGLENQVSYIIPDRFKDGYGISKNMIDYAIAGKYDTVVTVDNGISAIEAVEYAKLNGIDVVITDHHTVPEKMPNADIIVNPKQNGETYPFTDINGATVAWYLSWALSDIILPGYDFQKNVDLLGITAISDVMPLKDINVLFVREAISAIRKGKRAFYLAVWNHWTMPVVDEKDIAFSLVPMLNATGRMDYAGHAVDWIMHGDSGNNVQFDILTSKIRALNSRRQTLTQEHLEVAVEYLNEFGKESDKVIVVKNYAFHEGIIGIVAGKLAEMYKKPAYVFTYSKEKNVWKGSGRTYGNVHLYDLTASASKFIQGFGGHKGAVGLGVTMDNIEKFEKKVKSEAAKLDDSLFINSIPYFEVDLEWIDEEYMQMRAEYAPFGEGNPEPELKVRIDPSKCSVEKILKNKHTLAKYIDANGRHRKLLFFYNVLKSIPDTFKIEPSIEYNPTNRQESISYICRIE